MKRIVVACGSGIATSGLVANKINNLLEERGMVGKARADSIDIKSIDLERRIYLFPLHQPLIYQMSGYRPSAVFHF